jgi:2'-hydroxyisoflavone reductase
MATLSALKQGTWDAVIDTSGYLPRVVRASAELLASRVGHYSFISSTSVYRAGQSAAYDEAAPMDELPDRETENVEDHYGGLKAACERVVEEVFPTRSTHVRAGLIVGPHDPTGRFTYWVTRVARGGEVLAPGRPDQTVQFIDVRDIAAWIVHAPEDALTGPFNVVGPVPPTTMAKVLETCRRAAGSNARFTWVDEQFLLDERVEPWTELQLWVPDSDRDWVHLQRADVSRAISAGLSAGLRFRPLEETCRDPLGWAQSATTPGYGRPFGAARGVGLPQEREAAVLGKWRRTRRSIEDDRGSAPN